MTFDDYCRKTGHYAENGDRVLWNAAVAEAYERCRAICEAISDEYQRREGMKYPELKSDAQTGASDCEAAIRAAAPTPRPGAQKET